MAATLTGGDPAASFFSGTVALSEVPAVVCVPCATYLSINLVQHVGSGRAWLDMPCAFVLQGLRNASTALHSNAAATSSLGQLGDRVVADLDKVETTESRINEQFGGQLGEACRHL